MTEDKLKRISYFAHVRNELESGDISTVFELLSYIDILKARIAELESELVESARLHGIGGSREAAQLARIAELGKIVEQRSNAWADLNVMTERQAERLRLWKERCRRYKKERNDADERVSQLTEERREQAKVHQEDARCWQIERAKLSERVSSAKAVITKFTKFCPDAEKHGPDADCGIYGCKEGRAWLKVNTLPVNPVIEQSIEQARQESQISCGGVEGHAEIAQVDGHRKSDSTGRFKSGSSEGNPGQGQPSVLRGVRAGFESSPQQTTVPEAKIGSDLGASRKTDSVDAASTYPSDDTELMGKGSAKAGPDSSQAVQGDSEK